MVLRSLSILLLSGVALATAEEELLTLPMAGGSQTLVLAAAEVGVRAAANPDAPLVAYPVGAVRSPRTRVLIGRHVLVRLAAGADPAPPQPSDDELELERDMEYFVEPEEALGPRGGDLGE